MDYDRWQLRIYSAYGWDAEYAPMQLKNGKESALGFDITYTGDIGKIKAAQFQLHVVHYKNHQDELGDWAFPNMFSSENDVQFRVIIPLASL